MWRSHTSNLTTHLKALEQQQRANAAKRSSHQEIINLRVENNKIQREQNKEPMKQKVGSLRKSMR